MKKAFCFAIIIGIGLGTLTAQQNYCIAGDTSGVLYYDIVPDISLSGNPYNPPDTFGIDIDLNGTDDFLIESDGIVSSGTEYWGISVKSYGSNKIAYSHIEDSKYLGIGFDQGDTINNDVLFTDGTVHLKLYDVGPSWYYYYSWTPGNYIPVCLRIESSSECIYGWIKVYDVTLYGITLDSYAVNIVQSCLPEGITFETQAQIDSFQINYYGCTEIEGDVRISGDDITNLDGLSVLTSIGGELNIWNNAALTSLSGLNNVTSIGGGLYISDNYSLISLSALDNLDTIGGAIHIIYNESLSVCDVPFICEYLSDPISKHLEIHDNAQGCNGVLEMAYHCGITYPCLTEGTYDFYSQGDINYFALVYPGCSNLSASVNISGSNITHLDSLSVITSIDGYFKISQTGILDFSGLENLSFIRGDLDLVGDYSSYWGGCGPEGNHSLIDFTGLEGLDSIGGYLQINCCISLSSLAELANIESSTIEDLIIIGNYELSDCEIESICAYLVNPHGEIEIFDNAIGCNSPEEVQDSCEAHSGYIDIEIEEDDVIIYPNPANQNLHISAEGLIVDEVMFYTLTGEQIISISPKSESIDISTLPPGMYIVEVMVEGRKVRRKLLVE